MRDQKPIWRQIMQRLSAGLWALALLISISLLPLVQAQTTAVATSTAFGYDSPEVTVSGTVSGVFKQAAPGMIAGSHLLLSTASGPVDASLGRFALIGKGALSVSAGQQVEATGVMKTIKNKQVFMARSVKAGGQTYAIRNKHGFALSPQARERASQKMAGEGL
jgi:Phage related protein